MSGSLSVQLGSLRTYSQQHGDVADAVSQVSANTPDVSAVSTTYGNIASGVSTALGDLLGARGGALTSTASKAQQLAEGLLKSAGLYEQGDQQGAEAIKAAAGSTGTPSSANSASSGAGQMLSQLSQQAGQQVSQLAQTAGQAVAGLGQIPAQVLQGVQGIVETATGAGADTPAAATGPAGGEAAPAPADPGGGAPSGETDRPAGDEKADADDRPPGEQKPEPEQKPEDERPAPAPTRPPVADTTLI